MPDKYLIKGETLKASADKIRERLNLEYYTFNPDVVINGRGIKWINVGDVPVYYREYIDMPTVEYVGTVEGHNDYIVACTFLENNEGVVVPVLYKTELGSYTDPDSQMPFFYVGTAYIDGILYDKWRKIEPFTGGEDIVTWESDAKMYIYTNRIVNINTNTEEINPVDFPDKIEEVYNAGVESNNHISADVYVLYDGEVMSFADFIGFATMPEDDFYLDYLIDVIVRDDVFPITENRRTSVIVVKPDGSDYYMSCSDEWVDSTYFIDDMGVDLPARGWIKEGALPHLAGRDEEYWGFYFVKRPADPLVEGTLVELDSDAKIITPRICAPLLYRVNLSKAKILRNECFCELENLRLVDLGSAEWIERYSFTNSHSLSTLIIRTPRVCYAESDDILAYTAISDGYGYIYVPRNLVDSYKSATNWSEYAAQIRAIEDYPEITGG